MLTPIALGIAIAIGGAATGMAQPVDTPAIVTYAETHGYAPCVSEDSVGPCYWDATTRGNGRGHSFIVTNDGETFYGRSN